jgi:anti-sigma regulatory factor (Ser/Thr protein kinase)
VTDDAGRPEPPLLTQKFDQRVITGIRHAVTRLCAAAGLYGQRLDDFVLAVNEMMTNAVRHAGGRGVLTLWCADSVLHCEVSDDGQGIPAESLQPHRRPATQALSGRGLWLARNLCDSVTIDTGPNGTKVLLRIGLTADRLPA